MTETPDELEGATRAADVVPPGSATPSEVSSDPGDEQPEVDEDK